VSDNVLIFIPTDPHYIPEPSAQQEARNLLRSFAPDADEVKAQTTDEVELVFTGTNLERILCPVCGTLLDWGWWSDALDTAYSATRFTNLLVTLPCCGAAHSLNDLRYEWPTGFTRFRLEARNPNKRDADAVLPALERILGCQLRQMWAHI
jgi:hypothetical protein